MAKAEKKKNENESFVKNRIEVGIKYWEKENKKKFETFRSYLKTKHYKSEDENKIKVAFIHSLIRSKVPTVYLRNPKYLIGPKKKLKNPDEAQDLAQNKAKIMQALMNYFPNEIEMERELKINVLDYCGFGKGVAKVGFEFEMEELENEDEPKILVDRFYIKRVAYPDSYFVWDVDSKTGLRGASWCAEKITIPLKDIKSNPFFENTKDLKANAKIDKEKLGLEDKKRDDSEEELLEYWMYWEKNKYSVCDKYKCIVLDQNVTIKEASNPYNHGDWPYEDVDNYIIPDYAFPIGDIEPIMDQQRELDEVESLALIHTKRFIQKYKIKKGLDSKAISALESPENTGIELDDMGDIQALENPNVNQSVPQSAEMIKNDMNRISGISDYQQASLPEKKTTLGEAYLMQGGSRQRSDDALGDIEDFVKRIGRKLMQLIQQFLTEEMVIKISGDGSKPEDWQKVSPEDIQGEFDLDVEPYSTAPVNKELQKKQAMDLYNLLSKDPSLSEEAKNELRRFVLDSFDFKNVEPFMVQGPKAEDILVMLAKGATREEVLGQFGIPAMPTGEQGLAEGAPVDQGALQEAPPAPENLTKNIGRI